MIHELLKSAESKVTRRRASSQNRDQILSASSTASNISLSACTLFK